MLLGMKKFKDIIKNRAMAYLVAFFPESIPQRPL